MSAATGAGAMKRVAVALAVAGLGCAASGPAAGLGRSPPASPVPDATLGLSRGSVFDMPTPPVVRENASGPGERPVGPRAYPGAPPVVPHAIRDFLPLSAAVNPCLDCHAVKEKRPGGPTPIPPSHYLDLRNAPARPGEKVAGARFACTACHVALTDAPRLVGNAFRP
jgi:cytochrome c-type protein NapB